MPEIRDDTIRDLLDIKGMSKEMLKAVLTYPNIAIVDREAQPPIRFIHPDASGVLSYEQCKQDMLKAGYVKEVKDD